MQQANGRRYGEDPHAIVTHCQYDGIAAFDDLVEFWERLPNPDKQFSATVRIPRASFQEENYLVMYDIRNAFLAPPVARCQG